MQRLTEPCPLPAPPPDFQVFVSLKMGILLLRHECEMLGALPALLEGDPNCVQARGEKTCRFGLESPGLYQGSDPGLLSFPLLILSLH